MKITNLSYLILVVATLFSSCASQHKTVEHNRWIPQYSGLGSRVLMVHGFGTDEEKKTLQDYLTQRFDGPFIITTKDSILGSSKQYADTISVYRYGIIYSLHTIPPTENDKDSAPITKVDLQFYDRRYKEYYPYPVIKPSTAMKAISPIVYQVLKSREVWTPEGVSY